MLNGADDVMGVILVVVALCGGEYYYDCYVLRIVNSRSIQ